MFRPTFENLEKREVFSVAQPLDLSGSANEVYVEEISSGFESHTRPANDGFVAANGDRACGLAVGPNVHGIAGDYNNDGNVDAADYVAARNPAGGAGTWSIEPKASIGGSVDYTHPDLHRGILDNVLVDRIILPYIEQGNVYNVTGALDAAFAQFGPRGILLDPEARGNIVDIIDGTSNTIIFAGAAGSRACVTDLIIDPFDSRR